ncbi:MAG: hypothetical protein H0W04_01615 [Chthoniobacterales bacterium]|nr:hypothetical protein [Chthoniobacterales bacterium]
MFVQIGAIYRVSQLIAHPLLAAALVLSAMLIASGAGAAVLTRNTNAWAAHSFALLGISLALTTLLFPVLLQVFYPEPTWARGVVSVAWIALPAFFMGFPFPYSLSRLGNPNEVPWALAMNGFGSVLGSVGATLVAVHFGFFALGVSAVGLYVAVWLCSVQAFSASRATHSD